MLEDAKDVGHANAEIYEHTTYALQSRNIQFRSLDRIAIRENVGIA